jgi:hypothetical protein
MTALRFQRQRYWAGSVCGERAAETVTLKARNNADNRCGSAAFLLWGPRLPGCPTLPRPLSPLRRRHLFDNAFACNSVRRDDRGALPRRRKSVLTRADAMTLGDGNRIYIPREQLRPARAVDIARPAGQGSPARAAKQIALLERRSRAPQRSAATRSRGRARVPAKTPAPYDALTRRWRGMDSKFQFRDASPPPTAWPSFRRVSGSSLSRRNCWYRFAEADDRSGDSAAPTVGRPQPDRSLEIAAYLARN